MWLVIYLFFLLCCSQVVAKSDAEAFLDQFNREARDERATKMEATWRYNTNITDENSKATVNADLKFSQYLSQVRTNASKHSVENATEDMKRQFSFILSSATSSNQTIVKKVADLRAKLKGMYSKGCVKAMSNQVPSLNKTWAGQKCLSLDPDLYKILSKSRNYTELQFAWKGWRDATGPAMKSVYTEFVDVLNSGARENKWKDYGDYVRSWYEVGDQLGPIAEKLWIDLKPFYEELHAYVRFKLSQKYAEVKDGQPIPAHVLGNMWAQTWTNIYDLVAPFPEEPNLDISTKLEQLYKNNITDMFVKAEEFFTSIGWMKLPNGFWKKSMLEKPKDGRSVVCHASAWDFAVTNPDKDVRVKMCTSPNQNDFITIHHELGHIYYYLWYWNQPYEYRTGANPGFHEAVGDTLALSVETPQHLYKVGLLDSLPTNNRSELNFLLKSALSKIAFIPFGYLMDQWRWAVWNGTVKPSQYNSNWWELRTKYQGVVPPVNRNENDFDPGAKYHIPGNTPYIRYFMSYVYQFHFHKAACKAAKHTGTLNKCSIYKSKEAGKIFSDMLSMGKSKTWQEAFQNMTGYSELTAQPIKDYFQVLYDWMKEQRRKEKYSIGWSMAPSPTKAPTQNPTQAPTKQPNTPKSAATPLQGFAVSIALATILSTIFVLF
ncbi:angiotensin-converting enzyme-like [Rhopilema esculentum]|uniref:angiotensin-converting enzyme-like n=1 Tax=Rhopilema esculentum TaxID=499914 RepID=UPI0031E2BDF7